jgi:hypothetical protein
MKEIRDQKFANEDAMYQLLNLIFYAMVGVPLVIFLYLYLEIKDGKFIADSPDEDLHQVLVILVLIFCLINVALSFFVYRKYVKSTDSALPLIEKLQIFYKASVIKFSFMEAATISILIGLFLTAEQIYIVLYLVLLLLFSLSRPTPYKFRKDMKIKTYPPSGTIDPKESKRSSI